MLLSAAAVLTWGMTSLPLSQAPVFTAANETTKMIAYLAPYPLKEQKDVAALWDKLLILDVCGLYCFQSP